MTYEEIKALAELVWVRHYSHITFLRQYKQDFISEGILKALVLIPTYDESRSSLRNYLYTGMRNVMHNMYYHLSLARSDLFNDTVNIPCTQGGVDLLLVNNELVDSLLLKLRKYDCRNSFILYLIGSGFHSNDAQEFSEQDVEQLDINARLFKQLFYLYIYNLC